MFKMSKGLNHEKNSPALSPDYSQDSLRHIMNQLVFQCIHVTGSYSRDVSKDLLYFVLLQGRNKSGS